MCLLFFIIRRVGIVVLFGIVFLVVSLGFLNCNGRIGEVFILFLIGNFSIKVVFLLGVFLMVMVF